MKLARSAPAPLARQELKLEVRPVVARQLLPVLVAQPHPNLSRAPFAHQQLAPAHLLLHRRWRT